MKIYIEYLLIDNTIIDLLIIWFTSAIVGIKFDKSNICVSTAIGVAGVVVLPLISIRPLYLIIFKIGVGLFMVIFLKKYANFRQFLIVCIALFTSTFLFGGVCYGIVSMLGLNASGSQILINGYDFPISIFVLIAGLYFYLILKLINYLKIRSKLTNFYFDVTIKQNNNNYHLRGYLDSGNKLTDGESPVVIMPFKQFVKIFKDYPVEKVPLGSAPNNPHYISTCSVGDKNKLLVIDVEEVHIKNSEKNKTYTNVKLGISKVNFSSDFDLLLHSSF